MQYSIKEILSGIFTVLIVILFIDSYNDMDKFKNNCCCNIDLINNEFKSFDNINETLINNPFCISGHNLTTYAFHDEVIDKINYIENKFNLSVDIYRIFKSNAYCWNLYYLRRFNLGHEFIYNKCITITEDL